MSFENDIPAHLASLRIEWTKLNHEKRNMFHDCECEYCDYDGLKDGYTDEDVDKITTTMKQFTDTFERVKRHGERSGIDVSEPIISAWVKKLRSQKP